MTLDASAWVQLVGGKAVVNLDENYVLKLIDAIKAKANNQDQLKLIVNLGSVNYESLEVLVSDSIVKAAAGIEEIEIVVNSLSVTLPVQQFADALKRR